MKDDRTSPFRDAGLDRQTAEHIPDTPQTRAPAYRLAFDDEDFLLRDELRPVRLQLELLKPQLVLDERGGAFIDAAAASARAAGFAISEPGYKRVPAGLPADHPRAGWLRQKDFNAFLRGPHPEELGQSAFVDWCAERLVHLAPVLAVTEGL